ncbi:MAG: molybdenum cofactor guanylyltransferase [Dokdonella sp.]|uniref:molybdenum cofactor guanylyltransferase n=1 Tax=Dokdonella sp. TaxID=2291710 RepID=UPI0032668E32
MTPVAGSITFAILAGGAAVRMGGRDKGLEPFHGRPLIAWVIDAAASMAMDGTQGSEVAGSASCKCPLLISANRSLDDYARYGRVVTDRQPGFSGPLAGIAAALAACTTEWLITLPVDCPDPPRDLLIRLIESVRAQAVNAVVAHDGERRQPLFAVYARLLASSASQAVGEGRGVWHWQTGIGAHELDFADRRRQFRNLNTPEDFDRDADSDNA